MNQYYKEANIGYVKAEEILPMEMIELIQEYVDGQNIYIPRKAYSGLSVKKREP